MPMNYFLDLVITTSASKKIKKMDRETKSRIQDTIEKLRTIPPQGDIKSLKGYSNIKRCRAGKWRIIFEQNIGKLELIIYKIDSRGQIYKK